MDSEDKNTPGGRLRKARKKKYDTQHEFSIAADVTRETINKSENDKADPTLSTLQQMAKALDMATYELVRIMLQEK